MKAPLLASHDREGTTKVSGWLLDSIEGRGELFLAPKAPLAPLKLPPLSSKRAHKEPRKTCGREIFHQAALLYGSAGCLRRETQEGQGNGNACSVCKKGIGAVGQYRHVSAQAALSWSAKLSGQRVGDAGSGLIHGRTEAPRKRWGSPRLAAYIGRATGMHTERRAPKAARRPAGGRPHSPASYFPKTQKGPFAGALVSLFPRPAGAGHGHRNYSALSALAGASVLASGRRVSSMIPWERYRPCGAWPASSRGCNHQAHRRTGDQFRQTGA